LPCPSYSDCVNHPVRLEIFPRGGEKGNQGAPTLSLRLNEGFKGAQSPEDCPQHAEDRFMRSMNCAQAVFETFAPSMGMPAETARRVASAFAGGMGMGSQCGAVSGALMVIGMKYGKTEDRDSEADQRTFSKTAEFIAEFRKQNGHISCSELLGCNISAPEGLKTAQSEGLFTTLCPRYVRSAAEILDRIFS
jgi:C_GCAxxG_C_C family probable redox protein